MICINYIFCYSHDIYMIWLRQEVFAVLTQASWKTRKLGICTWNTSSTYCCTIDIQECTSHWQNILSNLPYAQIALSESRHVEAGVGLWVEGICNPFKAHRSPWPLINIWILFFLVKWNIVWRQVAVSFHFKESWFYNAWFFVHSRR